MGRLNHLLVPTDFTSRSECAIERALELCRTGDACRLTLLHVMPGLPARLSDQQQKATQAFFADRIAQMPAQLTSRVNSVVCKGDALATIIRESSERAVDLVVIGAPGQRRYADVFVGTTTELVIRLGVRPILMVKQPPHGPYRRVVVAFDASEGALRAFRMALAIAPNAEFRVVHAWWKPRVSFGELDAATEAIDRENAHFKELIHEAVSNAAANRNSSAKVTIELIENNPYTAVTNQCSWADLIVMGTHSKGRLARTVSIGQLARHVLVEASCDVLMSRP